jgi:hypothetical protein
VAAVASEIDGRVGAAAWGYAAALGLALVYLGERYLVDVVTGGALATAIHRAEPAVRRPAARISALLNELCGAVWESHGRRY